VRLNERNANADAALRSVFGFRLIAALSLAAALALAAWIRLGPVPPIRAETTPVITDCNGVVLYEPLSGGGTRSEWLTVVPDRVAQATIAAEDRRFERHLGIDPIAVVRAAVHDVRHLSLVEGGSTITQQVAKMLLTAGDADGAVKPAAPRSFARKLREAVVALRLEHRYTKREILALYVNLAPYGDQTIGIARASRRWFGCAPEELTAAQAAWLAALPQRPSSPRRALLRQRTILARMNLTPAQLRDARAERLAFERGARPFLAPHFVEHVRALLATQPPATVDANRNGGLQPPAKIVTTLDAGLQREVEGIIAAERPSLLRHGAHSVAVAVLDNRSGEWLAWEGSGDYFGGAGARVPFGGAIDGVTTLRQPGSALKPFTYALAFEKGFTPATVLADVPSHFPTAEEGVVYTPRNYDGRYRGPLRARLALAGSENIPAVQMLSKSGAPSLLRLLRTAGFRNLTRTADYYGLGLTLGDAEVTLEQLIVAYATFARGGLTVNPTMLKEQPATSNRQPATADRQSATGNRQLVSQRTAFWITDILSDPRAREYVFGSGGSLDFPFPVAVKTGTSQAYRDNWTVGYTREVTVGVWVGNFDLRPLRNSTGVTGAGPIFHSVMLAAVKRAHGGGESIVDRPPDLEQQPICAISGHRPSTNCPSVESEWLPRDAPVEFCSWHHDGWTDWPPEYREWSGGLQRAVRTTRGGANQAAPRASRVALRITSPPNDATYLIDPTLRREFQALPLRATAEARWSVDGKPASHAWALRTGTHEIVATNERGERDSVRITVR
jgi:penicillin-binding protein 1C